MTQNWQTDSVSKENVIFKNIYTLTAESICVLRNEAAMPNEPINVGVTLCVDIYL